MNELRSKSARSHDSLVDSVVLRMEIFIPLNPRPRSLAIMLVSWCLGLVVCVGHRGWMDGERLSCHQRKSREEGLKHVVWGREFSPWASMWLGQVKVGAVRPRTRVFGFKVQKCE
jgi:predicted aminopeptidase